MTITSTTVLTDIKPGRDYTMAISGHVTRTTAFQFMDTNGWHDIDGTRVTATFASSTVAFPTPDARVEITGAGSETFDLSRTPHIPG